MEYFETLGARFIAGGDYNAKHLRWGSRRTTTRGKGLQGTTERTNYNNGQLSTSQPNDCATGRKNS